MEIRQIINLQYACKRKAKTMIKEKYRTYDAIWAEGIRITPELEGMEEKIVSRINAKMPNLLMKKDNRPDIEEMASKHGFSCGRELASYLLAYQPRGEMEKSLYLDCLQAEIEDLGDCTEEEKRLARIYTPAQLQSICSRIMALAKEMTQNAYAKYDAVWYERIRISPQLLRHGKDIVSDLNRVMPNLLTHNPMCGTIDQIMMEYDFDSEDDLVDWLLSYRPRGEYQEMIFDRLVSEELGLGNCATEQAHLETDIVPF